MKNVLLWLALGGMLSIASCEKSSYCMCYGKATKYIETDYTPEEFNQIRTRCQNDEYCTWHVYW